MDKATVSQLADRLYEAERNLIPIAPLTDEYEMMTMDDAYAVQLVNIARAVSLGYRITGKKIGLTSPGIQQQLGVNEPDYGHLFDAMDNTASGEVDSSKLLQAKIEGEIAFILKETLTGGNVTLQDVIDATDYVAAAFEIVDSRVADWRIKLADTISDNASSGRYIIGKTHLNIHDVDLPGITMQLYKNGELIARGTGTDVIGNPALAVAWLANKLFDYGVSLNAGEIILSGAFSAAPEARRGDVFKAVFSSFGEVSATFV